MLVLQLLLAIQRMLVMNIRLFALQSFLLAAIAAVVGWTYNAWHVYVVAVLTLIGIMVRPFKWNEAMIAMAGAGLLLIIGLINPLDAFTVLLNDWNIFLFFLGMMTLSALAEAAGLFDWLAAQAAHLAGGSSRRLLLNTFLLGNSLDEKIANSYIILYH